MAIYDTTAAGAQDGQVVAGVWAEGGATILLTGLSTGGLQFVVFNNFNAEGTPLDPPLIYPSFELTLTVVTGDVGGSVDVYFVPEAAPLPYSNALLPGGRDEVLLVESEYAFGDPTIDITVPTVLMVEYLRNSSWNGIISLTLVSDINVLFPLNVHSAEGADPTLAPSINTTEVPFHTGEWEGPAFGRRARTRHCPRTGMPVASDHMVRDGYVEGMMVSAEGWEPSDPEDRYFPNPLEGVVDDEV